MLRCCLLTECPHLSLPVLLCVYWLDSLLGKGAQISCPLEEENVVLKVALRSLGYNSDRVSLSIYKALVNI